MDKKVGQSKHPVRTCAGIIAVLMIALVVTAIPSRADEAGDAKAIVDQAEVTMKNFMNDPDMKWFSSHLQEAKGVYIVPKLTKGAFIFGVEGGNGVVLARTDKGGWSEPVFYETSAASFGLQAGAQSSEAVVLIMTPKAVDSLLANKIKLGAGASVAVGPRGGGGADTTLTADFVTFTRAKGLYAGVSFDGASIRSRDELNAAYYGSDLRPSDIIIAGKAKPNPHSKELHAMLATAAGKR
jgi:SH3 domain-containing YSC84-like protein 1